MHNQLVEEFCTTLTLSYILLRYYSHLYISHTILSKVLMMRRLILVHVCFRKFIKTHDYSAASIVFRRYNYVPLTTIACRLTPEISFS